MKPLYLLIATALVTACGGNAEQNSPQSESTPEPEQAAASLTDDAPAPLMNADLWVGDWRVTDKITEKTVAHLEFRVDGDRLKGQYTLTQDFCQTVQPEFSSYCPFTGQGGSWFLVETNPNTLLAQAPDPFISGDDFVVTLFSLDGKTIALSSIVADAGRVSFDGEVTRAPS